MTDAVCTWAPDPDGDPALLPGTFGGVEAVAEIAPGTVVDTWTFDCFGGSVRTSADLSGRARAMNPQTGPFHVTGAEPGDTLAVHFVSLRPRHGRGVSTTVPFFGALTGTRATATLHPALPERTWVYALDLDTWTARYRAVDSRFEIDLPLDPMHGTVGVAPAGGEARSTLAPGEWGGNLDTPEMRAGATCYLGVNVPGALFAFGDGHARQGEGETCGTAIECAMDTVLIVELLKGVSTPWPRIEDDEYLMTTGSARPLEDAYRIAHAELVRWVAELTGLSQLDAYQFVSQTALSPAANVVDTQYTMIAKLPKRFLPGPLRAAALGGAHGALRERARQTMGDGPGALRERVRP
jgi:acetamidase/formamidase